MEIFFRLFKRFSSLVLERYEHDREEYSKALAILNFSIIITISFFYFFAFHYFFSEDKSALLIYTATTPFLLLLFWIIRKFHIKITGTYILISASIVLFSMSVSEGGLYSIAIVWLPSVVLVGSFVMASKRIANIVTLMILFLIFVIFLMHKFNYIPATYIFNKFADFYYLNSLVAATVIVYLFMNLIIKEKNSAYRNIQEEKKKLIEANKSREKMFSVISHDLRGPVSSILRVMESVYSDLQNYNSLSQEEKSEQLELVQATVDQTRTTWNLLENLLSWSLTQQNMISYEINTHKIEEILRPAIEILKIQSKSKNIKIITEEDHLDAEVQTDIRTCQTAIRNIISNAIKFSYRDSIIKIKIENHENAATIHIADQGAGMTREKLSALLKNRQPGSTPGTENEIGTGLGLQLVFEYIRGNKGSVSIESTEKSGTTFSVTLPK